MENEIWVDIKGYEGLYSVSDMGRVKSLERSWNIGIGKGLYTKKEKVLKNCIDKDGYCVAALHKKNSVAKLCKVHRLVAQAFIPNPLLKETVNHKNGIKTDNRVTELEWSTVKENIQHSYDTKLRTARLFTSADIEKSKEVCRIKNAKIILNTSTGIFYSSVKSAAWVLGIHNCILSGMLTGRLANKTNCIYA